VKEKISKRMHVGSEGGFTLIELLVVIIIIAILAAIAIPMYLSQRQKGWDANARSDLRNAAVAQESYFTDNDTYTDNAADELEDEGWNPSANVELSVESSGTDGYCMQAYHTSHGAADGTFTLDSEDGEPVEGANCGGG
jgi:type IV pilus assembly protein PilA